MKLNPIYINNPHMREFVNNLPQLFEKEGTTLHAERNIIKSFIFEGKQLVVKRFRIPTLLQRIIYSFFRKSKAERAFRNGILLQERNISTPCSIAYLEQWEGGLFKYGYYVTKFDDASPIQEQLNDKVDFDRSLADAFATFVAGLHQKGILHHDLNSTNALYYKSNGNYHFSLIDINRMDILPVNSYPKRKKCIENLTRFTGRMDVFEYVLRQYAICRQWDVEVFLHEAIQIKLCHDKQRKRKKTFLKHFKKRHTK